jgi:hypothetical protein
MAHIIELNGVRPTGGRHVYPAPTASSTLRAVSA